MHQQPAGKEEGRRKKTVSPFFYLERTQEARNGLALFYRPPRTFKGGGKEKGGRRKKSSIAPPA